MTNYEEISATAYFRRFVGSPARFRFQLRGRFFPLDGTIEAVVGPKIKVRHQGGVTWVVVAKTHPQCDVQSVDIVR